MDACAKQAEKPRFFREALATPLLKLEVSKAKYLKGDGMSEEQVRDVLAQMVRVGFVSARQPDAARARRRMVLLHFLCHTLYCRKYRGATGG